MWSAGMHMCVRHARDGFNGHDDDAAAALDGMGIAAAKSKRIPHVAYEALAVVAELYFRWQGWLCMQSQTEPLEGRQRLMDRKASGVISILTAVA